MIEINCSDIAKACGGKLISGTSTERILNICIDSRKVACGDLFIPIKGERFDGHDFLVPSLQAGAVAALTQQDVPAIEGKAIIRVDDTQKALKDIAAWYRGLFDIPLVGITGSVGKTSTKDMIASVLAEKYSVLKTQGNFNNEIGLPLTLFNLDKSHEAAVIEMGMSNLGEISRLTAIAKPHIAVITNIGMSHIENLGSRENILKAKLEILEGLDSNGLVVLNSDDGFLAGVAKNLAFRTKMYGIENEADYRAYNVKNQGENGTDFTVKIGEIEYNVHIPVPGIHNVYNALAAMAAGVELGIPVESIIQGIAKFSSGNMRLNIITHNGIKIINDAYNASPNSMEAAINVLKDVAAGGRSAAVLGDMLELGDWAPEAHRGVGIFAAAKAVSCLVAVGQNARYIAQGARESGMPEAQIHSFDSNEEAIRYLRTWLQSGDVVLVKGSRGMKMEQIVEELKIEN